MLDWLPIIARDKQWDWTFLIRILRHKLVKMERYFERDSVLLHPDKTWRRIRYARILCDRLLGDYLELSGYNAYIRKWGESRFIWAPFDDEHDELVDITHSNAKTTEDKAQAEREYQLGRFHEREEFLKRQDARQLGEIIGKYLFTWWD